MKIAQSFRNRINSSAWRSQALGSFRNYSILWIRKTRFQFNFLGLLSHDHRSSRGRRAVSKIFHAILWRRCRLDFFNCRSSLLGRMKTNFAALEDEKNVTYRNLEKVIKRVGSLRAAAPGLGSILKYGCSRMVLAGSLMIFICRIWYGTASVCAFFRRHLESEKSGRPPVVMNVADNLYLSISLRRLIIYFLTICKFWNLVFARFH